MRRLLIAIALACILPSAAPYADDADRKSFELRGKITLADHNLARGHLPVVFLQGSTTPFTTQAVADREGEFRFKNLLPGMYTLIVAIPRSGELKQTVDIGPSVADSKGRVSIELLFEPKPTSEEAHQVPVSQLAIPANAQKEYDRALVRLEKREVEKAVEHLRRAVEIAPKFSRAWNHLGTIAYQSKKYDDAERYFRESLLHDPDSYAPLVNLGGALLSLGKVVESLPINRRAVAARPDDALAHSQLGQSYFHLGHMGDSIKHLKQAKALDPAHFSHPQIVLAEIYARQGDLASLVGELEDFVRHHPDSKMTPGIREGIEKARSMMRQDPPEKP